VPYVFLTILLGVYGQLMIKWQINSAGALPATTIEKIIHISKLMLNPWILSSFAAAFIASISWMFAMSKVQLSYAYPFLSLTFVLIFIFSVMFFDEPLTWQKVVGLMFVIMGLCVSASD
jgi:multidrug transporter EmrE-like cation transporter